MPPTSQRRQRQQTDSRTPHPRSLPLMGLAPSLSSAYAEPPSPPTHCSHTAPKPSRSPCFYLHCYPAFSDITNIHVDSHPDLNHHFQRAPLEHHRQVSFAFSKPPSHSPCFRSSSAFLAGIGVVCLHPLLLFFCCCEKIICGQLKYYQQFIFFIS